MNMIHWRFVFVISKYHEYLDFQPLSAARSIVLATRRPVTQAVGRWSIMVAKVITPTTMIGIVASATMVTISTSTTVTTASRGRRRHMVASRHGRLTRTIRTAMAATAAALVTVVAMEAVLAGHVLCVADGQFLALVARQLDGSPRIVSDRSLQAALP